MKDNTQDALVYGPDIEEGQQFKDQLFSTCMGVPHNVVALPPTINEISGSLQVQYSRCFSQRKCSQ
jgi:hypothetical protein